MKSFDIYQFDKFIDVWQNDKYKHLNGDQCMRALGFKSAQFDANFDPSLELDVWYHAQWYLSEEEFILFALRFA